LEPLFDALRKELESEGLTVLSASQWGEIVSAYRKFASLCAESVNREVCAERLRRYKELFKNFFKFRLYKVLKYENVPEDTMDRKLLYLVISLIKDFIDSLDEVIADEKGRVYVIVKKRLEVGKVIVNPNEVIMMELMEAIALSAFGYVELLRIPSEGSKEYSWIRSERVRSEESLD